MTHIMTQIIPKRSTGLRRIYRAFLYSVSGLRIAIRDEAAFRQELLLAVALSILCLILPFEDWIRIALIALHMVVLITELLNTAVESVVNKVSPEFHEEAKKAKDTGSAAVMLSLLLACIIWLYAIFTLIP